MDRCSTVCLALGCLLVASCQDASVGSRTYPDAVVTLSQVDPAYRPYFVEQNGSNYSIADQRAAFVKAAQTARGPMPTYEVRSSGTTVRRKGKVSGKSGGKSGAKSGGKSAGKKPAGKPAAKKPAAGGKKPAAGAKKPAAKKPAPKKKK